MYSKTTMKSSSTFCHSHLVLVFPLMVVTSLAFSKAGNAELDQNFDSGQHQVNTSTQTYIDEVALEQQISAMERFLTEQMALTYIYNNADENVRIGAAQYGVPDLTIFRSVFQGLVQKMKLSSACTACKVYTGLLMRKITKYLETEEDLKVFALFTCNYFRLAVSDVCNGVIQRLIPTFYWIAKHRNNELSPAEFCGISFQFIGFRVPHNLSPDSILDWEVDPIIQSIAEIDPHPAEEDYGSETAGILDTVTPMSAKVEDKQPPMKILQLTDLHIDLDYKVGSNADCANHILCCQEKFGYPNETQVGAGYYGDNRECDASLRMLHMALRHIKRQHPDIELVYMTGDIPSHSIWATNAGENKHVINVVSSILYEYFPNTKVIPCLGNHDSHPFNQYSPSSRTFSPPSSNPIPLELRQDWVYETAYKAWKQWIPTDQIENFLKAGYYVVEVNENFRVIVINTNVCYGFNMWQMYAPRDPSDMLSWLQDELSITLRQNKFAHIVSHIAPGHEDCFKTWSREFYKIIARYDETVKGQFYGHTHFDEFRILHDPQNKTVPTNVMWIGPSFAPYRALNPGYRIYHVDQSEETYGNVVDHETWTYDIEMANQMYRDAHGNNANVEVSAEDDAKYVKWFRSYQATKAYNISDVLPHNMKAFVLRMAKEEKSFHLFYKHYYQAMDADKLLGKYPCSDDCRTRILCGIVMPYYDDDDGNVECSTIQKELQDAVLKRTMDATVKVRAIAGEHNNYTSPIQSK